MNVCFLVTLGKLMAVVFGLLASEMGIIASWQPVLSPVQTPCPLSCLFFGLLLGFSFISFLAYYMEYFIRFDFVSSLLS